MLIITKEKRYMSLMIKIFLFALCFCVNSVDVWCASLEQNDEKIVVELNGAPKKSVTIHVPHHYKKTKDEPFDETGFKKSYSIPQTSAEPRSRVSIICTPSYKDMDPVEKCTHYRETLRKNRTDFADLGSDAFWAQSDNPIQNYVLYCAYTQLNKRHVVGMIAFSGNGGGATVQYFTVAGSNETAASVKERIKSWFVKHITLSGTL